MGTDRDDQLTRRAEEIAAVEMPRLLERTRGSEALYQRAVGSMPGGVASSFQLGDPYPVYLSRGVGAEVWDVDGNAYFDFHNGFGSMAVGHAHPVVAEAVFLDLDGESPGRAPVEIEVRPGAIALLGAADGVV